MASLSVPHVRVGKSKYKKSEINLNHDCSTSTDWGFVQPLMVKKMVADSTLYLNALRSIVRVAPLVKPTFGAASWRTYHYFVKIAELYPPYEYFLSGKPYFVASQSSSYVPTQMPWLYVSDLTRMLYGNGNKFTIYRENTNGTWQLIMPLTETIRNGIIDAFISHTVLSNSQESGFLRSNYVLQADDLNINSADFVIEDTVTVSSTSYHILVCGRLNRTNRNVRKVLLGCGYQLDPNLKREVCILPLMAYYRAWFELFAPKRESGWTSTNAFNMLDYCRENAVTNIVNNNYVRVHFKQFISEIANMYYADDPDFISSHIATPSVGQNSTQLGSQSGLQLNSSYQLGYVNYVNGGNGVSVPTVNAALGTFTSAAVRMLDSLTKFVNKDSQIAYRLDTWLAAHGFGRSLVDVDPHRIGQDKVPIDIQSVMSTSDTENAGLGDFAGTAYGAKDNKDYPDFKFTTDAPGYWITLGCCVPEAGWYQGLAPDSGVLDFRRYDEYFSEFDALGFEISNKDQVVCDGSVSTIVQSGSDPVPFGFIPRSSRHKVIQNIVNGDVSLRSQRNDALPYTLDRYITPKDVKATHLSGEAGEELFTVEFDTNDIPIATPEYRYIGKWNFIGNFDRIFQQYELADAVDLTNFDNYPYPDHFIVHNYFDMTYQAPVLSMADSYDTDSFDNDAMQIEKA